jgi:hypothetical protein
MSSSHPSESSRSPESPLTPSSLRSFHDTPPVDIWADTKAPILYSHLRALASGRLIDVTETARVYGYLFPVAASKKLWQDLCAVPRGSDLSVSDRLGAVLCMGLLALEQKGMLNEEVSSKTLHIELFLDVAGKVPVNGMYSANDMYTVKIVAGTDEYWRPVYTFLKPEEGLLHILQKP